MEFKLVKVQLAVFLSSIDSGSNLKIASLVTEEIPEVSKVEPLMLPGGDDVPPEIPQIRLGNETTEWVFQFARSRCDFFYSPTDPPVYSEFPEVLSEMEKPIVSVWSRLDSEVGARAHRLGLVVNFRVEIENAADVLRNRYFNQKFGENAKEAQVHYLQLEERDNFKLNHWTRIISGAKKQETASPLVLVVDVNTLPETRLQLDTKVVQSFLDVGKAIVFETATLHAEDD
jgi:hypothetical protein